MKNILIAFLLILDGQTGETGQVSFQSRVMIRCQGQLKKEKEKGSFDGEQPLSSSFETESPSVSQAGLELTAILLPRHPKSWGYGY